MHIKALLEQHGSQSGNLSSWQSGFVTTFRLKPEEDLKMSLLKFTQANKISAGSVISAVGSLSKVNLRLASAKHDGPSSYLKYEENFEIVSLVGTMEYNSTTGESYGHFHVSLADDAGKVIGGHLMEGCEVFTTAEVTLVQMRHLQFTRVMDSKSGYKELFVSVRNDYSFIGILQAMEYGLLILMRSIRSCICNWQLDYYSFPNTCGA